MPSNLLKAIIAAMSIVIVGCSAGGGETGTGLDDRQNSVGVITGFGSVYVNGVRYNTDNATISIDDQFGLESQLETGMLVSLKGNVDADGINGTAAEISFERNVLAVVTQNSMTTSNRLDVTGQIVVIDNDTIFDSKVSSVTSFDTIAVNNVVDVSGYSSGDGTIYATRISVERESYIAGEEIKIRGVASNVTADQFQLGKTVFSYTESALEKFGTSSFTNGQFVVVKSEGALDNNNNYIATEVELKNEGKERLKSEQGKTIEIEGIISQSINITSNEFSLNQQLVKVDPTNIKLESITLSELLKGEKVEVKGLIDASGTINATEIEGKKQSNQQLEGVISFIESDKNIITVSSQQVLLTTSTRVKDDRDDVEDLEARFFNINNLKVGDFVKISAFKNSEDLFVATRLELDDEEVGGSESEWELEGEVTSLDPLTIDGQVVELSSGVFTGQVGDIIKLRGYIDNEGTWIVEEYTAKEKWEVDEGIVATIDLQSEVITIQGYPFEINVSKIVFNGKVGDVVDIEGIVLENIRYATEFEIEDDDDLEQDEGSDDLNADDEEED